MQVLSESITIMLCLAFPATNADTRGFIFIEDAEANMHWKKIQLRSKFDTQTKQKVLNEDYKLISNGYNKIKGHYNFA